MLKGKLILLGIALLMLFTPILINAQDVLWASKVIEFSSQLSPVEYSANQVLHKPNVYPEGGENPNAWLPKKPENDEDFIKVGFEKPIKIQQIAVAESLNPSAVQEVYLYDENDKEYLVFSFEPVEIDLSRRLLNIFIDKTDYEVHALKLVMNGSKVPGYSSIDAIGISESKEPIKIEIKHPEGLNFEATSIKLSENVNSKYKELKPLISPDGNTLYFSRQNHPENMGGENDFEDIWFSEKDETGEWKLAQNIGPPLNNKGPNFISSITPDGNTALILLGNKYGKNEKMSAGVSISTKTSAGWEEPVALEIINDYNGSPNVGYYLANNRKVLIMSVQRNDTQGDRDLYVSFAQEDGKWSEPLNLGTDLNTASEESSPFLAADDKTLYFSSNGFSGYGGRDIYVTRRLDDTWTNWSEPENLGPGINSPGNDVFFNIDPKGEKAYFSKSVGEDDADIFTIGLPELFRPTAVILVKGKVIDRTTKKPVGARIFYEKLPGGEEIGTINSDPVTGEYQIMLPTGVKYGYLAESDGYVAINENIDLEDRTEYAEIEQNLILVPIKKGETVRMNNIFFNFDKSTLKESSFPELNRIVELLKDNPTLKIRIAGHTDNVGTTIYNQSLSERRAQTVYDFLTENNIDKSRLSIIGYGKDKPLVSNDDEKGGREFNRRVEFEILEK